MPTGRGHLLGLPDEILSTQLSGYRRKGAEDTAGRQAEAAEKASEENETFGRKRLANNEAGVRYQRVVLATQHRHC